MCLLCSFWLFVARSKGLTRSTYITPLCFLKNAVPVAGGCREEMSWDEKILRDSIAVLSELIVITGKRNWLSQLSVHEKKWNSLLHSLPATSLCFVSRQYKSRRFIIKLFSLSTLAFYAIIRIETGWLVGWLAGWLVGWIDQSIYSSIDSSSSRHKPQSESEIE